MLEQTIMWRRVDEPGHDACGLWTLKNGWRLAGTAVFRSDAQPCHLHYEVECDHFWHTRSTIIHGWIGRSMVKLTIDSLAGGRWAFNGIEQAEVAGLVDIDLGFTPATNLIQLRRLALGVGQGVDAPVVYLHFPELTLGRLEHRYHRIADDKYDYQAPRFGYTAQLQVSNLGFVTHYPGLWEVEAIH